jgi:hypothetical protein
MSEPTEIAGEVYVTVADGCIELTVDGTIVRLTPNETFALSKALYNAARSGRS